MREATTKISEWPIGNERNRPIEGNNGSGVLMRPCQCIATLHLQRCDQVAVEVYGVVRVCSRLLVLSNCLVGYRSFKIRLDKIGVPANRFGEVSDCALRIIQAGICAPSLKIDTGGVRVELYCFVKVRQRTRVVTNFVMGEAPIGSCKET